MLESIPLKRIGVAGSDKKPIPRIYHSNRILIHLNNIRFLWFYFEDEEKHQNARRVSRAFELILIRYPENGVYMVLLGGLREGCNEGCNAFPPLILPTPLYHTLSPHPVER